MNEKTTYYTSEADLNRYISNVSVLVNNNNEANYSKLVM